MAITYVGGDNDNRGATTSIQFTLPTHATDDFGIAFCYTTEDTATMAIDQGWSELRSDINTTGSDYLTYIFYKKLTSGSETSPTVSYTGTGAAHAGILAVFRGVDTTTPFDVTEQYTFAENNSNPTCPAITPVTNNGALVLIMGNNGNEISAFGAPSTPAGMAIGPSELDPANILALAYLLDHGTASTITPTAWTNTVSGNTYESAAYSLVLRSADAASASVAPLAGRHLINMMGN
jgi:hypothetical protein